MSGKPALDQDRLAEAALALMSVTQHDDDRVWKPHPWSLTDRLFEPGHTTDPKSEANSVQRAREGRAHAERVLRKRFGRSHGTEG